MSWIEARIERNETIVAPTARVWQAVSSVERLASVFPAVESMHLTDRGECVTWLLEPQSAAGLSIRPRATTRICFEQRTRIRIEERSGAGDNARIRDLVEFAGRGKTTRVAASLELAVAPPIPFFAAPIARSIARRRTDRLADGLLGRVRLAVREDEQ